jgi:hypothetical protein
MASLLRPAHYPSSSAFPENYPMPLAHHRHNQIPNQVSLGATHDSKVEWCNVPKVKKCIQVSYPDPTPGERIVAAFQGACLRFAGKGFSIKI